jgi:hypothetical protein
MLSTTHRVTGSRLCDELVKVNDLLEVTQGVYEEFTAPDPYTSVAGKLHLIVLRNRPYYWFRESVPQ